MTSSCYLEAAARPVGLVDKGEKLFLTLCFLSIEILSSQTDWSRPFSTTYRRTVKSGMGLALCSWNPRPNQAAGVLPLSLLLGGIAHVSWAPGVPHVREGIVSMASNLRWGVQDTIMYKVCLWGHQIVWVTQVGQACVVVFGLLGKPTYKPLQRFQPLEKSLSQKDQGKSLDNLQARGREMPDHPDNQVVGAFYRKQPLLEEESPQNLLWHPATIPSSQF